MKNLILFFSVVLNSLTVNAQTSKGSIIAGGSINNASWKNSNTDLSNNPNSSTREYKYTDFGFYPNIAYFIKDKFSVGVSVGLNNTEQISKYSDNSGFNENIYKNNNTSINIFVKRYFLNEKNFGPYAGLSAGAGPSKGSNTYHNSNYIETKSTTKGTSANAGLNFGLAYFPTPKIGLQAGVAGLGWWKFEGKTTDSNTGEDSKRDGSGINFTINSLVLSLGIYYIFSFKK